NHDLKVLVSESVIRDKIKTKDYEKMGEIMLPYIETSLFVDEVMNLKYEAQGNKTKVSRISKQMEKDRYSAVSYGLFYIYLLERENQKKRKETIDARGFMAIKKPKYKVFG